MVLERLAQEEESDRPLHLQLHFVPPHEPYDPPQQHDLFGDPEYQGDLDGSLDTMNAINKRQLNPSAADIDEIISLYDGNLRRADSAVSMILSALQQRPRWSETVVLLVSDHAEAMYEHGLIGHNATVYDDMLRVPFILRLPDSVKRGPVDTGRLVSLADIVPTLLATVPLAPPQGLAGVNLLADPVNPSRYLISRTADPGSRVLGLRTARWKLINANGYLELYDLRSDPGEHQNLANQEPLIAAGLAKLLQQQVRAAPQQTLAELRTDVDTEDLAMLRELGYVD
jgi:arylsulfatase A-like enzyme